MCVREKSLSIDILKRRAVIKKEGVEVVSCFPFRWLSTERFIEI